MAQMPSTLAEFGKFFEKRIDQSDLPHERPDNLISVSRDAAKRACWIR